jgi:hypothetical protein
MYEISFRSNIGVAVIHGQGGLGALNEFCFDFKKTNQKHLYFDMGATSSRFCSVAVRVSVTVVDRCSSNVRACCRIIRKRCTNTFEMNDSNFGSLSMLLCTCKHKHKQTHAQTSTNKHKQTTKRTHTHTHTHAHTGGGEIETTLEQKKLV